MSTTADGAAAEAHEAFQNLTPDQLTEILALLPGADSVELKLTVPDTHRRTTVNKTTEHDASRTRQMCTLHVCVS